jgi:hypothetical protein
MPLLLLLLGVMTTAAGLMLVGSGLSLRAGTFDAEVATPGTIAAVGGLILIGLALSVRALQRIERALTVRPMPRAVREGEAAAEAANATTAEPEVRLPFPASPSSTPEPSAAPVSPTAAPAIAPPVEDAALEQLRAKFPTLARLDGAVVAPAATPEGETPPRAQSEVADVKAAEAVAPAHAPSRLDSRSRVHARGTVLQSFWPVVPRASSLAPAAQVEAVSPLVEDEPLPARQRAEPAVAVSVLKSGVVEGMAYTLYSDGSIEAQLPQGTMRFISIAALRQHIDSTS